MYQYLTCQEVLSPIKKISFQKITWKMCQQQLLETTGTVISVHNTETTQASLISTPRVSGAPPGSWERKQEYAQQRSSPVTSGPRGEGTLLNLHLVCAHARG